MKKTFRSIATSQNSSWQPEVIPSPLTQWYRSVCDVPIDELSAENLCRAVRQELFIFELLPVAIAALQKDLFFGYIDDGELLKALSKLPVCYWKEDLFLTKKMLSLLSKDRWRLNLESDVADSADVLADVLDGVVGKNKK
ncbi:contact-dependent growth inhibition system immunity protein [Pseudomonas sp. SDO5532_S415]